MMRYGRVLFSLLACFSLGVVPRASLAAAPAATAPEKSSDSKPSEGRKLFDYREITLDNGLHVITLEDFSCPIVNVQVWYHVGSKDENPERQGFAHMFEHMMFRGTERLGPTDHMDLVRQAGGECNAYTAFDQTVYHETLAAHQLELALWLEADRMAGLKIDQGSFDTERKVVEEERRRGLNRPFGSVLERVMAEVFHEHPYRWTPIGKIPHLRSAAVQELRDFWNKYYVPNNATLVVAGAVKHAEAQQLAKRHFGWIPRGADPPRIKVEEPWPEAGRTVTIHEDNAPAPIVGVLFRTVPLSHPDNVPLSLLTTILVGDDSSRLYRAGRRQKGGRLGNRYFRLARAGGDILRRSRGASFRREARGRGRGAGRRDRQAAHRTDHGTRAAQGANRALKSIVMQTLTIEGKASALGEAAVLEGNPARANDILEDVRRVTIDDLQRVARTYLVPERQIKVLIPATGMAAGPKKNAEEDAPITAEAERQAPCPGRPGVSRPQGFFPAPPLAAPLAVDPPPLVHTTHMLGNGLKLLIVPNHEVPFVSATLGLLSALGPKRSLVPRR